MHVNDSKYHALRKWAKNRSYKFDSRLKPF